MSPLGWVMYPSLLLLSSKYEKEEGKKRVCLLRNSLGTARRERIKANGARSNPFSIKCGVPQGCPLSPLAFLVIAEALTRLIQNDPHINGIEINGDHIKISQFADDTSLFAESYEEFLIALEWVEVYEKATGSKVNTHKYVGIQWGTQKGRSPEATLASVEIIF
eukprot:scaffold10995_cov112-Isochrysis_galbana.AAC.1